MLKPAQCFTRADGLGHITEHITGQCIVCTGHTGGTRMSRAHTTCTQRLISLKLLLTASKAALITTNLCAGSEQQLRSQGSQFPSRAEPHKPIILLSCLFADHSQFAGSSSYVLSAKRGQSKYEHLCRSCTYLN